MLLGNSGQTSKIDRIRLKQWIVTIRLINGTGNQKNAIQGQRTQQGIYKITKIIHTK